MKLLLVDDDSAFRHVLGAELTRLGYETSAAGSGEEAIRRLPEIVPDIVLLDLQLPGMSGLETLKVVHEKLPGAEILMLTGHGSIDTAIESVRLGAFDYVMKPCPLDELQIRIQRALERRALRRRANVLERGLSPSEAECEFLGESPEIRRLLHLIDRVAASDSSVLVTGETGSGKERVARLLHARSPRRDRPFVVVDCAALQESLLQSELFGHERGAFTGADRARPGLFEVADTGTVFLDEIGEISPSTQSKLLRVLDAGTFRRLGGSGEIHVDVRVLAATNRDVPAMVRAGQFRADLFYRLSTFAIEIPPLRARAGDVELLARHFVAQLNRRYGVSRSLGGAALEVLRRHHWPGNVRELLHTVESALIVCEDDEIRPEHFRLPQSLSESRPLPTLDQLERDHIRTVLTHTQGNRAQSARILGISERNLYRKLKDYGLDTTF
jgi:DNA-binding NtrC family response regulator